MHLLDGKALREEILNELKTKISKEAKITLAIIYVGFNAASEVYIKNKQKYSEKVGINCKLYKLDENTITLELADLIKRLNEDKSVHGIILQSPIPNHLDFALCSNLISPDKDVDAFTERNVYNTYINEENFLPCTVKGIIKLLDYYKINVEGMNVVIIGRSTIVGKPLAMAFTNRNATVTLAHSKSKNLKEICKKADLLVSAVGKPKLVKADFVKENAIVIDVGISKIDGKLYGDVDFENVKDKCAYITPVPGGVGPMTIAMLLENTYEAYKKTCKKGESMARGKLIVIEGTDCSGKETQTKLLISRLREEGINVNNFSFPNYSSPTGKIIGGPYLGKEHICSSYFEEGASNVDPKVASLYYAADRKYNIDKLEFLLNNGANLILDRYIYSNMAHQGGKLETFKERNSMYEWLYNLEFNLLELPKPDLAVYLHMPTEKTRVLKANREELDGHEKDEHHLKSAETAYSELAKKYGFKTIECTYNNEIKSISEINDEVYKIVKDVIQK